MQPLKYLGIWMDHANANFIELNHEVEQHAIESAFTHQSKVSALNRSENIMHNKEHQQHEAYYKKIGEKILHFSHVVIFGPTDAKLELHNYLRKDEHFNNINIDIEPADKMTENEQYAFVKKHFEPSKSYKQ